MAKKAKSKIVPYLETWDTRYGKSQRIVLRKNTSLTALKQGERVTSR